MNRFPRTLEQAFGPYTSKHFDREPKSFVTAIVDALVRIFRSKL